MTAVQNANIDLVVSRYYQNLDNVPFVSSGRLDQLAGAFSVESVWDGKTIPFGAHKIWDRLSASGLDRIRYNYNRDHRLADFLGAVPEMRPNLIAYATATVDQGLTNQPINICIVGKNF